MTYKFSRDLGLQNGSTNKDDDDDAESDRTLPHDNAFFWGFILEG